MPRGERSTAHRDLQDSGSCGQGTCKLRDKNEQIWFTDEENVKIMHFMLLVKYLSLCYISTVRAASQGLNSIPTEVGFLLAEFSESRSYLYL